MEKFSEKTKMKVNKIKGSCFQYFILPLMGVLWGYTVGVIDGSGGGVSRGGGRFQQRGWGRARIMPVRVPESAETRAHRGFHTKSTY